MPRGHLTYSQGHQEQLSHAAQSRAGPEFGGWHGVGPDQHSASGSGLDQGRLHMAFGYLGHRHRQAYGLRHGPGSSMGPDIPMASGVSSRHLDQHVPSPLPELHGPQISTSGGSPDHRHQWW